MLVFSIFHNGEPSGVPDNITSECVTVARADSGICIIAKPEAVIMNSMRCNITIVNLNNIIQVEFSQALSPPLSIQS